MSKGGSHTGGTHTCCCAVELLTVAVHLMNRLASCPPYDFMRLPHFIVFVSTPSTVCLAGMQSSGWGVCNSIWPLAVALWPLAPALAGWLTGAKRDAMPPQKKKSCSSQGTALYRVELGSTFNLESCARPSSPLIPLR